MRSVGHFSISLFAFCKNIDARFHRVRYTMQLHVSKLVYNETLF